MCFDLISILHIWHNQQSIVCGHHQLPSEHNMPPSTICRAGNRILRNCSPAAEVDGDHRLALTRRQIEVGIGLERTCHDLEISQPAIVGISGSHAKQAAMVTSGVVMYLSLSWICNICARQVRQRRPERGIFHRQNSITLYSIMVFRTNFTTL